MSQDKYNEAVNLISNKFSIPDLIYQHIVVSDEQKDIARQIVKGLKEQIQDICSNVNPGKNNVIIPYGELVSDLLPKEKSEDMTRANRLYTYLSFLPVVHFHERPRITIAKKGDTNIQTIPIATFQDLQDTVSLMEYSDGVRPYILEWYYDILLKTYEDKGDIPDSKTIKKKNSKGEDVEETITEDRVAVTTKDLVNKHEQVHNETLTGKKVLQNYLNPLINQGYIDNTDSVLDKRANIYYPIIETKEYKILFLNENRNNFSQEIDKIVVNSTKYPDHLYMHSVLEPILKYSSEVGGIITIKNHENKQIRLKELINQYFGNPEDYFELKKIEEERKKQNNQMKRKKQRSKKKNH
jgi:hypothetical protein